MVGGIPVIGGLIVELLGNIIPRQRTDRIVDFLRILELRLEKIEQVRVQERLKSPETISLIEDAFLIAYRAQTEERRKQIAEIIVRGAFLEKKEVYEAKRMLSVLDQLTDPEIIVLQAYAYRFTNRPFFGLHRQLLFEEPPVITDPVRKRDSYSIRQSYHDHLELLGLIRSPMAMEKDAWGKEKIERKKAEITKFGEAFVRYIGGEILE